MGKVFVTGDTHGDLTKIINFIKRFDLQLGDQIIVLGDFGIFWRQDGRDSKYWIDLYEKECNGVHLYWIDGNHENFDIINSWNISGVSVYNNSEHIHYFPRGFITFVDVECGSRIESRKVLFLGGADSVDKFRRTEHLSWWEDEKITEADINNIKGSFYYVFTHCGPLSIVEKNKGWLYTISNINDTNGIHDSEKALDKLKDKILFDHWWFAHYHTDMDLGEGFKCIFNDFIMLGDENSGQEREDNNRTNA